MQLKQNVHGSCATTCGPVVSIDISIRVVKIAEHDDIGEGGEESEKAAADCSDATTKVLERQQQIALTLGRPSKPALSLGAKRARGGEMEEGAIAGRLRRLHVNAPLGQVGEVGGHPPLFCFS